ncbi:MAG: hypothetical protein MUF34_19840 [Polyangiaceae bacterium]|nr:hypothetical protein [Polyangiaceae bacterium]
MAVALVVAKIVLPPVGGSTPVEASSSPVLLAAPSIGRGAASAEAAASAAPVEAAASAASVEVTALPASRKPALEVAPSASALLRKRRPLPRGRDEERVPRRDRCSPPFSIDAGGVRHMKPGCQ